VSHIEGHELWAGLDAVFFEDHSDTNEHLTISNRWLAEPSCGELGSCASNRLPSELYLAFAGFGHSLGLPAKIEMIPYRVVLES
jgi:hypothetical protein